MEIAIPRIEQEGRAAEPLHQRIVLRSRAHRHVGQHRLRRDRGISLQHAGHIARRHAGDQRGVAYRPGFEDLGQPVRGPGPAEASFSSRPAIDPGILIIDPERQAVAQMHEPSDRRQEIGRDRHHHEVDLARPRHPRKRTIAAPERPDPDIANEAHRTGRQCRRMDDPQSRCDQQLEIRVWTLLVLGRIARDDDRLPAELREIARPQPRPLRAHEIARREVSAARARRRVIGGRS